MALAVVMTTMASGAAVALAQTESLSIVATDLSRYPQVELTVAAPPQLVEQRGEASYQVREGGQLRPVVAAAQPVDRLELALVVDTSGSMRGAPLAEAKAAARSFLVQLPPSATVTIVAFGATPVELSTRSTDRAEQLAAVDGIRAGGETALYDALQLALSLTPGDNDVRRAVVVLSDGGDTASEATLDATTEAFAATSTSLFAVDLRTPESNPDALAALASATTGEVIAAGEPGALAAAFDEIAGQLVRRYTLTWESQAAGATEVEIVLSIGDVRAAATTRLELSALPAGRGLNDRADDSATEPAGSATWVLVVGVAMISAAALSLALRLIVLRPPRARGLTPASLTVRVGRHRRSSRTDGRWPVAPRGKRLALGDALDAAGLAIRPGELVVVVAASSVVALIGGWIIASLVVGVAMAALALLGAKAALGHLARRRRRQFTDQLPGTLQMLAGALRAGHGLAQSIDTVARESESPTSDEFRRLTVETRLGRDLSETLWALAARVRSADFEWVVQAVDIHRDVGGDLAEILDSVAGTIQDRNRIRRQVSALTAEGRLSGWVLMAIPFAVAAMMAVTNPTYLNVLFSSRNGLILLGMGAVLMTVGGGWLRRITKPVF
jgi:tight adherence protein B